MRAALIIAAVLTVVAGCYRSHVRVAIDAGSDARPVDAGRDSPLVRDAPDAPVPPTCVVTCGTVEHVASFDVPPAPVSSLSAAAVDGDRLGVVVALNGGDFGTYSLAVVDLATGRVSGPRPSLPMMTHRDLTTRDLEATPDGFAATALMTTVLASRFPARGMVEVTAFDDEAALVGSPVVLGELPFEYQPSGGPLRATIFGRPASRAVAAVEGAELWLSHLARDPVPRIRDSVVLARFDDAPPRTTPVSGAMLPDGRVAVATGGYGLGLEPRDAFLVIERAIGEPTIVPLPGQRFDPPPAIVASDAGIAVFRHVSNPRDLDDSRLRAELRDDEGTVIDALDVRPAHGLVPVATATFAGERTAGLVWVEHDNGLRVLPEPGSGSAASWAECDGLAPGPITTLTQPLELDFTLVTGGAGVAMLALGRGDGSDELIVVVFRASLDDHERTVEVLRVPGCRLDRVP